MVRNIPTYVFRLASGLVCCGINLISQFISRLPIPDAPASAQATIGDLAMEITALARERYTLHERTRHRILSDLGSDDNRLNNKLTEWWGLTFPTFRRELGKAFKRDLPLHERDEWEQYLAHQRARHAQLTDQIVRLESTLNRHVYALFDLTPDEIALIETSTKYPYGAV